MKPDFSTHYLRGVEHFNAREFWDAHESWETIWLVAASDAEQFLQGLIQIAAAYHHVQRGTFRGAVRLFDAGLRRLSAFPHPYCGTDRRPLEAAARAHRQWTAARVDAEEWQQRLEEGDYPRIALIAPDGSVSPPSSNW
ncbi:MAG TPA: DUF309 domain-containing protein [Thermoanaerobaculia bacterium]|nr:DUF309 domain-containing protein [Thermoanaerobaculia bacterium]